MVSVEFPQVQYIDEIVHVLKAVIVTIFVVSFTF